MLPEEKMYLPKEVIQLDDLFDRVSKGDTDSKFFFRRSTLDYVRGHAAYRDDDFKENTGLLRFYYGDVGMTIMYSTVPTEECKSRFLIRSLHIDGCENEYTYNPDVTPVINF